MDRQLAEGFGIPQIRLPIPSPPYQRTEWYEDQQVVSLIAKRPFVAEVHKHTDHVLFYTYEQPRPNRDFRGQLCSLQQHYMFLDDDYTIIELLKAEPALYALLADAVKPLQQAFGDNRIVHVRVQSSDEDSLLKVRVSKSAFVR